MIKKKIINSNDFIVVIPARYQSSRLPGKPLIKIAGVPMLLRTFNQCAKVFNKKIIYVATDHYKIKKLCNLHKINVIMTKKNCLTGTDRVAEVAKKIKRKFYINVQGDEPICNPSDLRKLVSSAIKNSKHIINGYTEIKNVEDFKSRHIPKVVFREDGRLLYQSRAGIPAAKKDKFIKAWRQVCIYSFPFDALLKFTSRKKTFLESIEDLELNRFLELGFDIKLIKMSDKSKAIDTKKDLLLINKMLRKKNGI